MALPAYTEHMQTLDVLILSKFYYSMVPLERIYSRNGGYPNTFATQNTDYYTFTYTPTKKAPGAVVDFKNRGFNLKATPKPGSAQAGDRCGELMIKHDGSNSAAVNDCWE